jgi:hypothetical protein
MWNYLDRIEGKDVLKISLIAVILMLITFLVILMIRWLKPQDRTCKIKKCNFLGFLGCEWVDDPDCIDKTPDARLNPLEDATSGTGLPIPGTNEYNISGKLIGLGESFNKVINSYYYRINGERCTILSKIHDTLSNNELVALSNYYKSRYKTTIRTELTETEGGGCYLIDVESKLFNRLDGLNIP